MDECFKELLKFKRGVLINEGMGMKIQASMGKPLIMEKLCNNKNKFDITTSMAVGLVSDKMELEYNPQMPYDDRREGMTDVGDGMFKKTLTEGIGELVKQDTEITVHYAIFLENDDTLHDTTYITYDPFKFVLGRHLGILPGFERAVRTMRNQEKAEFIVPRLLNAENGREPTEDERKTGYLVIEVVRVRDIVAKSERARLLNNINKTLEKAEELREEGKAAFVAGFYCYAADMYLKAVHYLRVVLVQTPDDNKKRLELLVRMYLNAAIALNKISELAKKSNDAIRMLEEAAEICEYEDVDIDKSLKGKILLHLSRSYRNQLKLSMAFFYLKRAKEYLGEVKIIKEEFKNLFQAYDQFIDVTNVFRGGSIRSALPAEDGKHHPEYHDDFEATFDHMVRTFICCTKEKKKVVFGVKDDAHLMLAKKVILKNKKAKLEVQVKNETFCYILTKK